MGTLTLNSRLYQPQERVIDIPQQRLDKTFSAYSVEFSREAWPDGVDYVASNGNVAKNTALVIEFEKSLDGGVTWQEAGGVFFQGGTILQRDGKPLATSSARCSATDPITKVVRTQTAQLRARIKVLVPLRTSVSLVVDEAA